MEANLGSKYLIHTKFYVHQYGDSIYRWVIKIGPTGHDQGLFDFRCSHFCDIATVYL